MKNYLIIGVTSAMGEATAKKLQESGARIYGTSRKEISGGPGSNISYHYLDVMDEEPDLGFIPDKLDGFVYCPGSINLRPFHRLKPAAFREDFDLQVLGAVRTIQAALHALKASPGSSIVLFSTVAVQSGFNFHTQVSVSKGAIEGLTRSLAAELAPAVRVNAIAPSLTDTPLASKLLNSDEKKEANARRHPLRRVGTADDMANMAEFLLSEKSSWISGQVMHVDGGMSSLKI